MTREFKKTVHGSELFWAVPGHQKDVPKFNCCQTQIHNVSSKCWWRTLGLIPRNIEHFNADFFSCDAHNSQVTKLRSPNEGHWLNFGAQSQTRWISFQITLFGSTSSVTLIWRMRWCYLKSWKLLISPPLHECTHQPFFIIYGPINAYDYSSCFTQTFQNFMFREENQCGTEKICYLKKGYRRTLRRTDCQIIKKKNLSLTNVMIWKNLKRATPLSECLCELYCLRTHTLWNVAERRTYCRYNYFSRSYYERMNEGTRVVEQFLSFRISQRRRAAGPAALWFAFDLCFLPVSLLEMRQKSAAPRSPAARPLWM